MTTYQIIEDRPDAAPFTIEAERIEYTGGKLIFLSAGDQVGHQLALDVSSTITAL